MTEEPQDGDYLSAFITNFKREYGFALDETVIEIDNIQVRAIGIKKPIEEVAIESKDPPKPVQTSKCYFGIIEVKEEFFFFWSVCLPLIRMRMRRRF